MPLTSNQSNSNIPVFVENQVLRADDLNALTRELLRQMRQNRKYNIGVGVINGLDVNWQSESQQLVVSSGLAISSDGYTFELGECRFNHYHPSPDFSDCLPLDGACADRYDKLLEIAGAGIELAEWNPSTDALEISLGAWVPTDDGQFANIVVGEQSGDFCLLLIFCRSETRRQTCFNDCEASGIDQSSRIRAVLVPTELYRKDFGLDPEDEGGEEGSIVNLPDNLRLYRFGILGPGTPRQKIDLCRIENWADLYGSYRSVCAAAADSIATAYYQAYRQFYLPATNNPDQTEADLFFQNFQRDLAVLLTQVYPPDSPPNCPDIQYLYTYFRELILAYRAFIAVANGLVFNASEDDGLSVSSVQCLFPAHVSLGGITEGSACPASPYIAPDSSREKNTQVTLALRLFERMRALAQRTNLRLSTLSQPVDKEQLRITPGIRRDAFLRSRAIPFYYHNGISASLWNAGLNVERLTHRYTTLVDNPLLVRLEPYDFYRIEGHLGSSLATAIGRIEELRHCLNIAFDVLAVRIQPEKTLQPKGFVAEDLEAWYQNTRSDILCKLAEFGVESPDAIVLLREFLTLHPFLRSYPIEGPILGEACCELRPPRLGDSQDLLKFTDLYSEILKLTESTGGQFQPRFDQQMGQAIVNSVLAYHERRFQVELQTYFPCFAHAHPGLEHLGGVPKGGTFVLVYKEEPILTDNDFTTAAGFNGVTQRVVADFCLPYLCCGDQPIVRNEIREFRAEIKIPEAPYCWRNDPKLRPPIEVSVSPSGGTLRLLDSAGNELYVQENVGNVVQVDPNDFTAGANPVFEQGVGQLNFIYELAGGGSVNAIMTVYRQPVLNCDIDKRGKRPRYDEKCGLIGYGGSLTFATPIDLSGIRDLRAEYGPATDVQTIVILEADEVKQPEWLNAAGELARIELPLGADYDLLQLVAENGPCRSACEIELPAYCPERASFVSFDRYPAGAAQPQSKLIPATSTGVDIELAVEQDTGFVSFRIQDTGMRLRTLLALDSGEFVERGLWFYQVNSPAGAEVDCARDAQYFIVYNRKAAQQYLQQLAENGTDPTLWPFSQLKLNEVEDLNNDGPTPMTLRLEYYGRLETCNNEKPLATLNVNLTDPVDPQLPEEPGEPEGGGGVDPVTDEEVIVVAETGSLSAAAASTLNRRTSSYRNMLLELRESDNSIANANGFKRTNLFLDERDEAKIPKSYATALEATLKTHASTTEERKPLYATVANILTLAYLDKIVAAKAPTSVGTALKMGLSDLNKADIAPKKIKKDWKAAELKAVMKADRVEALNKQIKA